MRGIEQDQPVYYSSESEEKKTDVFLKFFDLSWKQTDISLGVANRTEVSGVLLEKTNSSRRFIWHR